MALVESALPELLDALRAGDGVDLIRDAVRLVMQELIELEAAEHIGAARKPRHTSTSCPKASALSGSGRTNPATSVRLVDDVERVA